MKKIGKIILNILLMIIIAPFVAVPIFVGITRRFWGRWWWAGYQFADDVLKFTDAAEPKEKDESMDE